MKQSYKWMIVLVVTWVAMEAISLGGLAALRRINGIEFQPIDVVSDKHKRILTDVVNGKPVYKIPDADLGWTIRPHGTYESYETNSLGMRGTREFPLTPSEDRVRIAAFGDSFTWGSGVGYDATWPAMLEEQYPELELMNFGVGGYGLDQAFLRYLQDGKPYQPHIVLIGYMTENLFRHVNTYRPFYIPGAGAPFAKPRFVLSDDELSLVANLMERTQDYASLINEDRDLLAALGRSDFYYANHYKSGLLDYSAIARLTKIGFSRLRGQFTQPIIRDGSYNTASEAYRVTIRLLRRFYCDAVAAGSLPLILIFPDGVDIVRGLNKGQRRYLPLLDELEAEGYRYVDLFQVFDDPQARAGVAKLVRGHYTERGNARVAEHIGQYLNTNRLTTVAEVKSARPTDLNEPPGLCT